MALHEMTQVFAPAAAYQMSLYAPFDLGEARRGWRHTSTISGRKRATITVYNTAKSAYFSEYGTLSKFKKTSVSLPGGKVKISKPMRPVGVRGDGPLFPQIVSWCKRRGIFDAARQRAIYFSILKDGRRPSPQDAPARGMAVALPITVRMMLHTARGSLKWL